MIGEPGPSVREVLVKLQLMSHPDEIEPSQLERAHAIFLELAGKAKNIDHFRVLIEKLKNNMNAKIADLEFEKYNLVDDIDALEVGKKQLDLATNPGNIMNR